MHALTQSIKETVTPQPGTVPRPQKPLRSSSIRQEPLRFSRVTYKHKWMVAILRYKQLCMNLTQMASVHDSGKDLQGHDNDDHFPFEPLLHYKDSRIPLQSQSWRLTSPPTRLFLQQLVQVNNTNLCITCPLWRDSPVRRQAIVWTNDSYFTDAYMRLSAPMS